MERCYKVDRDKNYNDNIIDTLKSDYDLEAGSNVFIIGSLSQSNDIDLLEDLIIRGFTVNKVKSEPDKIFSELVTQAFENINEADLVVVLLKHDGTIGNGTTYEVEYAKQLKKKIAFFLVDGPEPPDRLPEQFILRMN